MARRSEVRCIGNSFPKVDPRADVTSPTRETAGQSYLRSRGDIGAGHRHGQPESTLSHRRVAPAPCEKPDRSARPGRLDGGESSPEPANWAWPEPKFATGAAGACDFTSLGRYSPRPSGPGTRPSPPG